MGNKDKEYFYKFKALTDKRDQLVEKHFGDDMHEMLNAPVYRELYTKNIYPLDKQIVELANEIMLYVLHMNVEFKHISEVYASEILIGWYNKQYAQQMDDTLEFIESPETEEDRYFFEYRTLVKKRDGMLRKRLNDFNSFCLDEEDEFYAKVVEPLEERIVEVANEIAKNVLKLDKKFENILDVYSCLELRNWTESFLKNPDEAEM